MSKKNLLSKKVVLPVPVVVVGNISVGGTGKTPLLCALADALTKRGVLVGIISRGYGGSHSGVPRCVLREDDPREVGDEPLLLKRATDCPVVIGRDRLAAATFTTTAFSRCHFCLMMVCGIMHCRAMLKLLCWMGSAAWEMVYCCQPGRCVSHYRVCGR
ncbi:MAG: tetraacyldisaccharide 4'-kinase [Pseudomonadales bacterium]